MVSHISTSQEAMPQRQHFVHKSYLRGFANPGRFVVEYTLAPAGRSTRAIRSVFAETDMMTIEWEDGERVDELEAQWADIESKCGEPLKRIRGSKALDHRDDSVALAMTAALHWARGSQFRTASAELADRAVEHRYCGVLDRLDELEEKFEDEFERAPEPGEVAVIAMERLDEMRYSNFLTVTSMAQSFNKFVDWVSDKQVELSIAPDHGTGFSTSDSPLIIADKDTDRVGLGEGLALGDSSLILMPVSRRLACAFTYERQQASSPHQPQRGDDQQAVHLAQRREQRRRPPQRAPKRCRP